MELLGRIAVGFRSWRLAALVAVALLVVAADAAEATSGSRPEGGAVSRSVGLDALPPARFLTLRVCAYEAFSKAQRRCVKDQRAGVLVSSRFACSVTFVASRPGRLRARMTYGGEAVYQYTTRILGKGSWEWWISENVGTTPLPGGTWGCDFSFGSARTAASFRSGGPTGEIVGAAVCAGTDTISYGTGKIRVCRSDESGHPIPAADEIVCSAVFVKDAGKEAEIRLLSGGVTVEARATTLADPLSVWRAQFDTGPSATGKFPAGDYVCRFSLDGVPVVEKPFQIASG